MLKFKQLYEATAKPKASATIKIVGRHKNGLSSAVGVIFSINGQNRLAQMQIGRTEHPKVDNLERSNVLTVALSNSYDAESYKITGMESKLTSAGLWMYRDGGSISRNEHSFPVLESEIKSIKPGQKPSESEKAWAKFEKLVLAELKIAAKDDEFITQFNATTTIGNQVMTSKMKDAKATKKEEKSKATSEVKPTPKASDSDLSKTLQSVIKHAGVKVKSSGTSAPIDVKDFMTRNHLKSAIEDMGADFVSSKSNTTKSVYDLDGTYIEVSQTGIRVFK